MSPHTWPTYLEIVLFFYSYLWFFMEPILAKADNYSFLKKLVENVKQTRDAQAPDDEEVNKVHEQRSLQQDILFWQKVIAHLDGHNWGRFHSHTCYSNKIAPWSRWWKIACILLICLSESLHCLWFDTWSHLKQGRCLVHWIEAIQTPKKFHPFY